MPITRQDVLHAIHFHDDHAHAIGQAVAFVLPILETLERQMKDVLTGVNQVQIFAV